MTIKKSFTHKDLVRGLLLVIKRSGEYKNSLIFFTLLALLNAGIEPITIKLFSKIIDNLNSTEIIKISNLEIPFFIAMFLLWFLLSAFSHWLTRFFTTKTVLLKERIRSRYIATATHHALLLPISFHKDHNIGETTEKIGLAGRSYEELVQNLSLTVLPQFFTVLVILVLLITTNLIFSAVIILGLTIYGFWTVISIKPSAVYQREIYQSFRSSMRSFHDALVNFRAVKDNTAEKFEGNRLRNIFDTSLSPALRRSVNLNQKIFFIQRIVRLTTVSVVLGLSIFLFRNGTITIGALILYNSYTALIFAPFSTLTKSWREIQNGIIALEDSEEILSAKTEGHLGNTISPTKLTGDVEFKNVTFGYTTDQPILKNITFHAKAGQVIAFVGESGAGKSTLIDLISAYYQPTSGEVLIDGVNTKQLSLPLLRSSIAHVTQDITLFNEAIKYNITYGSPNALDKDIEAAAKKAHALDFIEKFPNKWEQVVGERGIKLSGGQKQRIAIARAMLRNPKILILDEPTSALDAKSEQIIQESLKDLMEGRTTFIIAHRLSTVRHADKILVIKDGAIIEQGKHDELIQKPNGEYKKLHDLQIGLRA